MLELNGNLFTVTSVFFFFYLVQGWKFNNLKRRGRSNFRRETLIENSVSHLFSSRMEV
jgi:hypothetical protein